MAANETPIHWVLMWMARELGEYKTERVTAANNTTPATVTIGNSTETQNDIYTGGLAEVRGRGVRTVTKYNSQTKVLTLLTPFNSLPAVNDRITLAWWQADLYDLAFDAVKAAIFAAWPYWYREVVTTATGLMLTPGNYSYPLPTMCDALIAVGVQPSSSEAIEWIGPGDPAKQQRIWHVDGEPGAFNVRFYPRLNRDGSFVDANAGATLALWYATKEPVPSVDKETTRLPLDYFTVASSLYRTRESLGQIGDQDLSRYSLLLPQIQQMAQAALQRLQIAKVPPSMLTTVDLVRPEIVLGPAAMVPQMETPPRQRARR